ncbi:MAG: menaquinone-dependent protoporphyrinogen IX dehydrogenase [Pseudomonadota bacterium]|nr:menaquinone-dependent protoporphyrinogen IX dehydrogenase [Pseudomonadota bacterium]MEC8102728.1 menaquinone-dependent protoporphyrinogen IX dehydrogenase [Pseudomonadota bacterium]MEC8524023.1 menaquinone-dependent protoporphyrinogen IX dehydrogenase [Pseudomonadota bacterium]
MTRILLVHSTTDGHTIKISDVIINELTQAGHNVSQCSVTEVSADQLDNADTIILGASIRYGKHQKSVYDFVTNNKSLLKTKKTAFFTVNVVARKENKNTPETNPYINKFLDEVEWQPDIKGVFAGKLNYPIYGPLDRFMIRLIMYITKGPTDTSKVYEFTNWESVKQFARNFD